MLEAAFQVDLAHFKTSRQQPTAIPQLYYSPCTPPFSPSYCIPGKPQKRSAAIRAIMQILLSSEDPRSVRTTESANSMLTFSQYNVKLLERTPSGGHFEIRITRFLPQMVINKKARVAMGRFRKSNVCFRAHCKKDPADTPQEDSLIQQPHETSPSESDLEKARCRRRLGQSTSENCASQYASERIHLKMSDGTAIVAKWTYLSSSDVSAEILEPDYLAGRQISSSHIPPFAMPVGNWYYKDFAVTGRAYAAMQYAADRMHAVMLYFKEYRQQLTDFLEVARKKATRTSGEIDESQLQCAFVEMVENALPKKPSIISGDIETMLDWLLKNRLQ